MNMKFKFVVLGLIISLITGLVAPSWVFANVTGRTLTVFRVDGENVEVSRGSSRAAAARPGLQRPTSAPAWFGFESLAAHPY